MCNGCPADRKSNDSKTFRKDKLIRIIYIKLLLRLCGSREICDPLVISMLLNSRGKDDIRSGFCRTNIQGGINS